MNIKRYLASALALFIFIFVYESFAHGHLLAGLYSLSPNIWRSYAQLKAHSPFNIVIMAFLAIWISFIFTRFYKNGGWKNGLRFGFYLGILSGIQAAGAYYYLPISFSLAVAWFIANTIESLIAGLIIGLIYRL